ncbi:MAG: Ig-like domain-containing protein [Chitinophagaceae bacterium]
MKNISISSDSILLRNFKNYSNIFHSKWLFLLLLVGFASGCQKVTEQIGLVGVCPQVISTNPANQATGIGLNQTVQATFNEPMNPYTINTLTFTLNNGTVPIAGVVTYTDTTATFTPTANLLPNTQYTGTVTTGVKDKANNAMLANYVWTFTTGTGPIPPTVISTVPPNGATGVSINKSISATFSEAMDSASTLTSFSLANTTTGGTAVSGTVSYSGTTVVFAPSSLLAYNTTYTATIHKGVKDHLEIGMVNDYVWTFTTSAAPTPPTVTSTDPVNAATGVPFNKIVSATFSQVMDSNSVKASFSLANTTMGGTPVSGTVSYSGLTGSFTPTALLAASTTYTATISTVAKDTSGLNMVSNYVWTFITGAAPAPPTVTSTNPVNAATNVALNTQVSATFSQVMDSNSVKSSFTLANTTAGGTPVSGTVSYSGQTGVFTPSALLTANTTYTATISTGAKNTSGIAMVNPYTWNFTTGNNGINLGTASTFGAFGGSAGLTNQGLNTVINNGGIGTTGASTLVTGFHDGITGAVYTETPLNKGDVTGGIFTAPPAPGTATSFAIATQALKDAQNAYDSISPAAKPGGIDPGAGELGGLTLPPGIYKSASGSFNITNGNLTLDAQGNANAIWIFQSASSLTVGIAGPTGARSVILINGAQANNVFWYVGSAATINGAGGGTMVGTIIAYSGVTFSTAGNTVQTVLDGRALSLNASVTMVNTTINVP